MLYVIAAVMTALVVAILLHPLLRRAKAEEQPQAEELEVYKAQLADIERDLAAGTLAQEEGVLARREVQRRILAADSQRREKTVIGAPAKRLALALLIILPLAGPGLYLVLGNPDEPAQPHAEREDVTMQRALQERAANLRAALAEAPADPEGWLELAMLRSMLGHSGGAVEAYRMAIAQGADDAQTFAAFAEALIMEANGEVTQQARAVLGEAMKRNETEPLALYYIGHALEQDERYEMALRLWGDMADALPEDSQWRLRISDDLSRVREKMETGN